MYQIFCFGDSITKGEYDIEYGGWVERLNVFLMKQHLETDIHLSTKVYNLGIGGETSTEALVRIQNEFFSRKSSSKTPLFIFAYGANDSAFLKEQNKFSVSKEEFEKNLRSFFDFSNNQNGKIILLGITPVIDEKNSTPNHKGKTRSNEMILRYNAIIEKVAKDLEITFVDIFNLFDQSNLDMYFVPDGLHPNSLGHQIIFKAVLAKLENFF